MAGGIGPASAGSNIYRDLLAAAKTNGDIVSQRVETLVRFTDTSLDNSASKLNQFISSPPPTQAVSLQALQRGGIVDQFV